MKKETKNLDKLENARRIYFNAYEEMMKTDDPAKLEVIKSKIKKADSILRGAENELKELKAPGRKTTIINTDVKVVSDGEKKTIYLKD